jgi:hypothetical protein
MEKTISIKTSQGVYGLFSNFDYTPWQALGEFVDNSVSSWMSDSHGDWQLEVDIDWDPNFGSGPGSGKITITDNALGISERDMDRAFELAIPPDDKTRLNKFGVGMKAAACWFGEKWTVETSAVGEPVTRTVHWDTAEIVKNDLLNLKFVETRAGQDRHFTRITITDLSHAPNHARTVTKIKIHLAKLFRKYIETGGVIIRWNGEVLRDTSPGVLEAPAFNDKSKDPENVRWETNFEIELGDGRALEGYACLFEKFERQHTGLNYFWRNRLIQGNVEPFHRPQSLFGATSSFRYGRLYIELIADDLEVTTDKTAINFGSSRVDEETLHEKIKEVLKQSGLPVSIIQQGENYRANVPPPDLGPRVKGALVAAGDQAQEHGQTFIDEDDFEIGSDNSGSDLPIELIEKEIADRIINHSIDGRPTVFRIACVEAGAATPWVTIEWGKRNSSEHVVFINLSHPFVLRHLSNETLPVIIGIGVSLLYGEFKAQTLVQKDELLLLRQFTDKFMRYMANQTEETDGDEDE